VSEQTRREREKSEHRKAILDAAESAFADKGFRGATVHEIAEGAEFSVGYLYTHFDTKEDLFAELVDARATEMIEEAARRLAAEADPVDRIHAAVAAKLQFFRSHERFFLIFARAVAQDRADGPFCMPEQTRTRYTSYLQRLTEVFEEGIRQGVFINADPTALAICMEGMTNGVIGYWVHSGGTGAEWATPEVVERILLQGALRRE
jgi:TetR/AcrR family transcriptional regulator